MTWCYTVIKYTTSEVRPSWASESWVTIPRLSGFKQGAFITAHKPAGACWWFWTGSAVLCQLFHAPSSVDGSVDLILAVWGDLAWKLLPCISHSPASCFGLVHTAISGVREREREQKFARSSEVEAGNWCFAISIVSSWLMQVARPSKEMENRACLYFGGLQNHCRWWLQPWN